MYNQDAQAKKVLLLLLDECRTRTEKKRVEIIIIELADYPMKTERIRD